MADAVSATVKRPSALSEAERAAWHDFMAASPALGRAFLSPRFAQGCEQAHGRARIAVLHDAAGVCAFLPFQYRSAWHAAFRAAEAMGGEMADHAGLIARPGFTVAPARLLEASGIGALFFRQLSPGQQEFGLQAEPARIGHLIDLRDGADAYFAALAARDRPFMLDTERRARRLEKTFGPVAFTMVADPDRQEVEAVIAAKRAQYQRTDVGDPLAPEANRRLLHALARGGDEACRVVLARLTAGDRTIAEHLGLLCRGTLSYWFPVYDPEARQASPGRLLLWQTIRAAAAHGIVLIDRGGGDTQAKRDFSTGTVTFGIAHYHASGPRGVAARLAQAAAWRLGR